MRWYLVFAAGLLALLLPRQSLMAQLTPLPQNVKLRLEIEIDGVLSVTEKSATLTTKETISEWVKNPVPQPGAADQVLQAREVDRVWVLELDENLKKTAKTLHGKTVTITGKCLLAGVKSTADTVKVPPSIGSRTVLIPRGGPSSEMPVIVPERLATTIQLQLLLDSRVTVISLKAAAPPEPD